MHELPNAGFALRKVGSDWVILKDNELLARFEYHGDDAIEVMEKVVRQLNAFWNPRRIL